jgi:predicted ArsR family transcriptional regulator
MSTVDKCLRYLSTHKKPVTVQQLSDYFLLSSSGVRNALIKLEQDNLVQFVDVGRQQYWSIVRHRPVAIPAEADQAQRPVAAVTSYPHVRGYDD